MCPSKVVGSQYVLLKQVFLCTVERPRTQALLEPSPGSILLFPSPNATSGNGKCAGKGSGEDAAHKAVTQALCFEQGKDFFPGLYS